MKRTAGFIFLAFCAVSALSLAEDEKKSKPSVTVSPADAFSATSSSMSNSTTTAAKHATTTAAKHATTTTPPKTTATTTAPPKPTTHKPTTHKPTTPKPTTHKPTTHKPTTHKPTTTTHKPTTTTHKPTTHKPTTTTPKTTPPPPPKPTPPVNLTVGNYSLMTDKKVICLMAQMALQIRLATPKTNGTFIVQPRLTKAEGGCQETKANLTLVFKEGSITFMFNKSAADNIVYVDALSFVLSYPFSKGGNNQYSANNKSVHLFTAKVGHSYSCKGESLYMGNGLYLDVNQDRMQAFNLTKSNDFGSPDPCAADQPDYRVAIAVGVTLLVLIVIVVVAYLLGRRRRADGYQSL